MKDIKEEYFYYGDDLGATCIECRTDFKIWSPPASEVLLHLYKKGNDSPICETISMTKGECGVWESCVKSNLHGTYYDYEITVEGEKTSTPDPYAKACGINSKRSMVIDLTLTNPCGWEEDQPPQKGPEDIIYELHVKEFSYDESGGFSKEVRGKYKAFLQENTTLHQKGSKPTGLSYLKQLGITHVQLMPIYDFGSVDERGDGFNWGYDPMNYNVPEGSYSMDPYHGEVRIREVKEMIQSLHKNGFRVIMDVVYNHTYSADSWLERMVPGYYYRHLGDGSLSNGSGCGNDVASEKAMCSRYILDSVLYWAEEYHVDGFRFDLMGLLDVKLMNDIRKELDDRYGRAEKLVFGEPWAAGSSPMEEGSLPSLKGNIRLLDTQVGMFQDSTRDAIKGHVFERKAPGFVNGGNGLEEAILHSASAWCDSGAQGAAKAPSQVITYASAHDNLTLWDKLVLTVEEQEDFHSKGEALIRAYKLSAAIYFTCQGRVFMLSGEEFARTKEGDEDSYSSPIEINRLDWGRIEPYLDIYEYYEGLIGLRKKLPGLCDKSAEAWKRFLSRKKEAQKCVSYYLDNRPEQGTSDWETIFVVHNAGAKSRNVCLPHGQFELLVDENKSTWWKEENRRVVEGYIEVPHSSAVILGKKRNKT